MEKSKKIICIILTICALSALCAVGASADDDPVITPHNNMSRSDQYALFGWSVDPEYFFYEAGTNFGYVGSNLFNKYADGPCIAHFESLDNGWTGPFSCSPVLPSYDARVACNYNNFNNGSQHLYYGDDLYFYCEQNWQRNPSNFGRGSLVLDSGMNLSSYQAQLEWLLNKAHFTLSVPEPDPEPIDPPSGSTEGALLDGFTWAQNIGYYASFSPLLDSNTYDPVYMGVTRMSRLPYDQITDSKFSAASSSNGCALIMGQKTDYSDILVSGTVGYGVSAMLVTSPFKLDSSTLGVDYTAQIFFASGDDPSSPGYTQVDASSLGLEEYTVRVWSIDYNEWSKIVMCRYYFVLDLGVSTPSFPTDTISVQFKSSSVHTHEWYWTPFDFRFQYALRGSESDPLPDSVINYNPATGSPTSNGGYNTSGSTVSSDLNEELTWANDELVKLNPMQQSVLDAAKYFYDDDGQMFQEITGSLESLYNSLSYTGVGGTLKFPRAIIPWGNSTLMLWPEQTIPFGEYINQIPTIYVTIISFLLVTGGWFAFVAISIKFFKRTFYGDVTSERF